MPAARLTALVTGLLLAVAPALPALGASSGDPLADLPVPVIDVTSSDVNLRDASREVTVMLLPSAAAPQIRKLRTRSAADASLLLAALNRRPGVLASPNSVLRATSLETEPSGAEQYDMRMIGAPDAWPLSIGGGVTVAVLDTGVDATNPDLVGRVLPELDAAPGSIPGLDANGHGTHVASIIGAAHNGTGIAGVAPGVSILPMTALDSSGYGDVATVARAVVAAANAGARVLNMSLGGPEPDAVLDAACEYAHAKGVLMVAAAGNSRSEGNDVQYPAASPHVIAVTSVDPGGLASDFANTGGYIDIAAPGERILGSLPGGEVVAMDGTSSAAPHVSGTLALIIAANPALTADDVAQTLLGTALDDPSGNGPDQQYGAGIVQAGRAVSTAAAVLPNQVALTQARRLDSMTATPQRTRKRWPLTLIAKVSAMYLDGRWLPDPGGTQVIFEFRANGTKSYKRIGVAAVSPGGYAALNVSPRRTGKWRARILIPDGSQSVTAAQVVKVRR